MKLSLVVPCYNERGNIRPLLDRLDDTLAGTDWEVIFVDDDSPDGTAAEIARAARGRNDVRLIHRIGERGLAGACIAGLAAAEHPIVAVMDADLQHDETRLPVMLRALADDPALDLVVGSRKTGGGSHGGGMSGLRRAGSDAANMLARKLLGIGIADPMSGFFMLRRARFDEVAPRLQKAGFKILADMLAASGGRWQAAEIPYEFRPRHEGESKMSAGVTLEFLALLLSHRAGARIPLRLMSYMAVGASGVGVQVATSGLLHGLAGAPLMVSLATGVLAAMTSNFFLNNRITYRDRALRNRALARGLLSFYAIGAIGAVANVLGADWVYGALHSLPVASSSGALLSMMWNFGANSLVTWPL